MDKFTVICFVVVLDLLVFTEGKKDFLIQKTKMKTKNGFFTIQNRHWQFYTLYNKFFTHGNFYIKNKHILYSKNVTKIKQKGFSRNLCDSYGNVERQKRTRVFFMGFYIPKHISLTHNLFN